MRDRNHEKSLPGATVYGSPSIWDPPNVAPYVNGDRPKYPSALGPTPRCGTSYGHICSLRSAGFSIGPASSSRTEIPRSARTFVTVPPPAPDPITTTSCVGVLAESCDMPGVLQG